MEGSPKNILENLILCIEPRSLTNINISVTSTIKPLSSNYYIIIFAKPLEKKAKSRYNIKCKKRCIRKDKRKNMEVKKWQQEKKIYGYC